jgi:hypothetical protein
MVQTVRALMRVRHRHYIALVTSPDWLAAAVKVLQSTGTPHKATALKTVPRDFLS